MSANSIPNAFVLTKIQAEAGQTMHAILNRKELERESGGTFWWGIGESKAEKIKLLLARDARPKIIFSPMLSAPNQRDANPDGVFLWDNYITANGCQPIPYHSIITSRAQTQNGSRKSHHYALVCENETRCFSKTNMMLDVSRLRNFGANGKPIGSSQITAVVVQMTANGKSSLYQIAGCATLTAPHAVKLAAPRLLSCGEIRLLDEVSHDGKKVNDWLEVAKKLRRN
jgi:hypothetical protein